MYYSNPLIRRQFLKTLSWSLPTILCPGCRQSVIGSKKEERRRPNILFIYTDDQAPWALGASGNLQAQTPNMDRLAQEGAYLVNSFTTTPVCSPSRASLLTSRYGSELGITDFIPPKGHRLYTPGIGLDPQTVTFPEFLAEAGYVNGLIGKWHVGEMDGVHPTRMGYHEFMGFRGGGISPSDPTLEKDGIEQKFQGLTTDILTDHAIDFLTRHKDESFLLSLHYRAPHKQWLPVSEEDWEFYKNLDAEIPNPDYPDLDVPKMKQWMCEYLASVAGIDRNLGRILQTLDQLKLSRNTVIIFSSDNGYNMAHNGIWHKGNGMRATKESSWPPATKNINSKYRPNMYDNSLRIPTMVRWPGRIKPGRVITQTISNLDWYPTILAMCDVELPENEIIRGHNFLPLLRGKRLHWDNDLYAEYSMQHYCRADMRMYRTPNWKLIRDFLNPERDELYNLKSDPQETTNLIESPDSTIKAVIADLHENILRRMREIDDPILDCAESNRLD
ncbi:MAG: sulfatase-like hydrolase/transferase [bacterium]